MPNAKNERSVTGRIADFLLQRLIAVLGLTRLVLFGITKKSHGGRLDFEIRIVVVLYQPDEKISCQVVVK